MKDINGVKITRGAIAIQGGILGYIEREFLEDSDSLVFYSKYGDTHCASDIEEDIQIIK